MKKLLALAAAAVAFAASDAVAQTTANVNVSARVDPACTISAAPLAFGAYDPLSGAAVPTTGDLTLTCTKHTDWTVTLGTGGSGSFTRAMTGATNGGTLAYNIFTDSTHATIWGDGTGGTGIQTGTAASKNPFTVVMYGLIPANADPNQDTYADVVVATVTF